jgi:uncharacterized protein involved in response to NO
MQVPDAMTAIPRYRPHAGPALLSAGFRPFFLVAALWASLAVPLWLGLYQGRIVLPTALPPLIWHVHELVFGYGAATVAGFLLTAIPDWTGRMPLQGGPLAILVALWAIGRAAVLGSGSIGAEAAAVLDLAFPAAFLGVVAREIVTGHNWRNLPMLGALTLLLAGNLLVNLDAVGLAATGELGDRIGIATLLMLISLVGGRIIPSFTRNWLARERPGISAPATSGPLDRAVLAIVGIALVLWVSLPESRAAALAEFAAAAAVALRLSRWRVAATWREPLLWVLHLGYGWLAVGFLLLAASGFVSALPATAALHALTVGAIGTMTLAVMTRASLGHTGRSLIAGPATMATYILITMAALLRLSAPFAGAQYPEMLWLAGAAWTAAFGLFVLFYTPLLMRPRLVGEAARAI